VRQEHYGDVARIGLDPRERGGDSILRPFQYLKETGAIRIEQAGDFVPRVVPARGFQDGGDFRCGQAGAGRADKASCRNIAFSSIERPGKAPSLKCLKNCSRWVVAAVDKLTLVRH
jgi:hypothetical protein